MSGIRVRKTSALAMRLANLNWMSLKLFGLLIIDIALSALTYQSDLRFSSRALG